MSLFTHIQTCGSHHSVALTIKDQATEVVMECMCDASGILTTEGLVCKGTMSQKYIKPLGKFTFSCQHCSSIFSYFLVPISPFDFLTE